MKLFNLNKWSWLLKKNQLQSYEERIQKQDEYIQTLVESQKKLEGMMERLIAMAQHH
ncbi:hypothetical protein M9H77_17215 [Catharanthus roseus]|uniref:Uncharacterized protein n=1 Tax=Catharanthus roseus TaxID=4058 RepID=A0ACC0B3Z1_CATRO|nr:hypothetical protein M9H77_17215 [Catharanthus roseus]